MRDFSEWDRQADAALKNYEMGLVTLTQARIRVGSAERSERLAYRFPRLLGFLDRRAAEDRLHPKYRSPRFGGNP